MLSCDRVLDYLLLLFLDLVAVVVVRRVVSASRHGWKCLHDLKRLPRVADRFADISVASGEKVIELLRSSSSFSSSHQVVGWFFVVVAERNSEWSLAIFLSAKQQL